MKSFILYKLRSVTDRWDLDTAWAKCAMSEFQDFIPLGSKRCLGTDLPVRYRKGQYY